MLIKRKLYGIFNGGSGKALIWDARNRRYVAHIEPSMSLGDDGCPNRPDNRGEGTVRKSRRRGS
ncbi:hypothetical protein [Rhodospirillum sp. A1_3_36]|uniref:hypothetical protein n=1 Tax=Rhodospirillum sp. A1_3_36 TaxID=3391666 RepID=UPI0039A4444C